MRYSVLEEHSHRFLATSLCGPCPLNEYVNIANDEGARENSQNLFIERGRGYLH